MSRRAVQRRSHRSAHLVVLQNPAQAIEPLQHPVQVAVRLPGADVRERLPALPVEGWIGMSVDLCRRIAIRFHGR